MTDGVPGSIFAARDSLRDEIEKFGKMATPSDLALLQYYILYAWWSGKSRKFKNGFVESANATVKNVCRNTGLSSTAVYDGLIQLTRDGWVLVAEDGGPGCLTVRVMLDDESRERRISLRRLPQYGKRCRNTESDSVLRNPIPQDGMATVSDLRKQSLQINRLTDTAEGAPRRRSLGGSSNG